MSHRGTGICLAALIFVSNSLAQSKLNDLAGSCCYAGEKLDASVYTFDSDQEAENAVANIIKYTGLSQNFTVHAANVPNAVATMDGSKRLILYSQTFMRDVEKQCGTKWAAISILAHEIGHHLNAHVLQSTGSRPELELEADMFSGFVLYNMGAKLDEAQIAMKKIASDSDSPTHPARGPRLTAIANGWYKAEAIKKRGVPKDDKTRKNEQPADQEVEPDDDSDVPHPRPRPDRTPPNTPNTKPEIRYVSRCVFQNDPNKYYVTSTNDIIGINAFGQAAIVARKIPPMYREFAWMYQTPYITYGVSREGQIWNRAPNGVGFVVGYVTNP